MDDFYNAKRLALILAVQAEIEGIKAANLLVPNTYGEADFIDKANDLRNLAYAHNEQL
jgi:hypothetical protein